MARYFFHLRDHHDRLLDPDGVEIGDKSAIPGVALSEARALIAAEAREGVIDLGQAIEVEDERGAVVHRLAFAEAVRVVNRDVPHK